MNKLTTLLTALFLSAAPFTAGAQAAFFSSAKVMDEEVPAAAAEQNPYSEVDAIIDSLLLNNDYRVFVAPDLPRFFFLPSVYSGYVAPDSLEWHESSFDGNPNTLWLQEQNTVRRAMQRMTRDLYANHPELISYHISTLPVPPKKFEAVVNPEDHTIEIRELPETIVGTEVEISNVEKRHWIRKFNAGLQFSQAYVSPNWYQGGNNNLNALGNLYYNVKLNPTFHPNLLFETTAQYKLGMNNAPDDEVNSYSISDDIFQVNTTFGVKAAKRWYYSFTGQFKTQLLNSYTSNTRNLRSSFMTPGELTVGVGMTYNYANAKKTFTFDASIAPLSYKLVTYLDDDISPTVYDLSTEPKVINNFGSSSELKLMWKITYNITYTSRLFAFTDYKSAQVDWEHKVNFDINRFLSTQLLVNARYDTATPHCDDPHWKKLQIKEILSIGFSYTFSTL